MTIEVLKSFIGRHYVELMCLLPVAIMMAGLTYTVLADTYIQKHQKRTMLILCALVFALIAQNDMDYLLTVGTPRIMLRRVVATFGYAVRPVILLLFLHIIIPGKKHGWGWALTGVNAALYILSIFVPVCYEIDANNSFHGGVSVFGHTCTIVSLMLLCMLLIQTYRVFHPSRRKEALLPVMVTVLILLSLIMDANVGTRPQPVSFLTVAVVIGCVMYYNWLHYRFVLEHEQAITVGQRVQLMLSQIKPHFLYNVLNMTQEFCDADPETAKVAINKFAQYLRENMDSIGQAGTIPFEQELNHTKLYLEIEQMRFEDALSVRYDITCTDFGMPALTLEPLVENAIRHGVRKSAGGRGTVVISTRQTPEHFVVSVTDFGPGFDPTRVPEDGKTHVGLQNVRERLAQVCGGRLEIQSAPGLGTTATILLPR